MWSRKGILVVESAIPLPSKPIQIEMFVSFVTLFTSATRPPPHAIFEFELAMSCDLRVCGEDVVPGLPETGLAIIPGAGGTQRLPRLVRKIMAKNLIFTGRKIGAQYAMSIGLINYATIAGEAHAKTLQIACEINLKGPVAIRMAKIAIDKGLDRDIASGLELEEECYVQTSNTTDRLEALEAFAEKRKLTY